MTSAMKFLIVGGVINLAYSFLTGFILAAIRQKQPQPPKYLMFAHTGPLMQGAMLLGLVFAFQLSTIADSVEFWSATLLVIGSLLLAAKDTLNWIQHVEDEFRQRPPLGTILGTLSVLASTIGLIIIIVGVFSSL